MIVHSWVDAQQDKTNLEITYSTFLLPRCHSNCHIVLYIMKLLNETHFEVIDFTIYIMQLIGMKKFTKLQELWTFEVENQDL